MPKRGKKISPAKKERVLRLLQSHGVKAVASEIEISPSTVYKIKQAQSHSKELSETALAVAGNLEKYRKEDATCIGSPHCIGSAVYGDSSAAAILADLGEIDREKAVDLFNHLKVEFAEIEGITEWGELEDGEITASFVNRLELKAHEEKFKGRCPHCPK